MNKSILLLGILSVVGSSFAQVRLGQEFQINTTISESELRPRVAGISADRFFVCWESENTDSQNINIHGQLFDDTGAKIGSEIKINQRDTAFKPGAQVISLGGNLIVVWEYDTSVENQYNIYARVYGKDGTPKTDEIELVSGYYNYSQDNYRIGVASLNNENFIVSWNDISNIQWIRFRIFN